MFGVSFVTSLKSDWCTTLPTGTFHKITLLSHTHKILLHFSLMYFKLESIVYSPQNGTIYFPSANHCQGQLPTPQSVTLTLFVCLSTKFHISEDYNLDKLYLPPWWRKTQHADKRSTTVISTKEPAVKILATNHWLSLCTKVRHGQEEVDHKVKQVPHTTLKA
jgi:hypothetical protein